MVVEPGAVVVDEAADDDVLDPAVLVVVPLPLPPDAVVVVVVVTVTVLGTPVAVDVTVVVAVVVCVDVLVLAVVSVVTVDSPVLVIVVTIVDVTVIVLKIVDVAVVVVFFVLVSVTVLFAVEVVAGVLVVWVVTLVLQVVPLSPSPPLAETSPMPRIPLMWRMLADALSSSESSSLVHGLQPSPSSSSSPVPSVLVDACDDVPQSPPDAGWFPSPRMMRPLLASESPSSQSPAPSAPELASLK